jgi:DNA-binding beta-propeller fold protein YncE
MSIQQIPLARGNLRGAIAAILLGAGVALAGAVDNAQAHDAFIPKLVNSSTVPVNGEVNPYGVAFVPDDFPTGGKIREGDVLAANFNGSSGIQGTGTTIVRFDPTGAIASPGTADVFFTSTLPGLSTALGVLRGGFVLVGNVPTTDGTAATVGQGALQVIDRNGKVVHTWTDPVLLDGPWDLTVDDHGTSAHVFVSNVLNGTVARFDVAVGAHDLTIVKKTLVANGYTHVPNAAAVVLGPTGLAFDAGTDTLYVASTADNAIYAVSHASHLATAGGRGGLVFSDAHLRGPLALRFAPNGDLLTANGDAVNGDPLHPSEMVEFTKSGHFVREYNVDPSQGAAFGMDTILQGREPGGFNYAAIDDTTNSIAVYRLPSE